MTSIQQGEVMVNLKSLFSDVEISNFPAYASRRHAAQVLSISAGYRVLLSISEPERVLSCGQSPDFFYLSCVHQYGTMNPYEAAAAKLLFHSGDGFAQQM